MWLAAPWTLEKYNAESQTFHVCNIEQTSSLLLPIATFMDSNGVIWAGSWNGLGKFDPIAGSSEWLPSFPGSTVYSLLEDSSQNLWVGSNAGLTRYNLKTGAGSSFTVRLPLGMDHLRKEQIIDTGDFRKTRVDSEDLKTMESPVTAENGIQKTKTVSDHQPVLLIVEDNSDMRHYIRKTMSDQYQIIEADNGKTGVTLAKESVPDLIISDIMMPEMDGYQLCEIIKTNELTSHIPVILLTAKADRESKLAGLEIGADDYLSKLFDADELKLIVRNRVEERRKLRERFSREITLEPKQISITSLDEKFLTKVLAIIEEHMDDEMFSIDELSREGGYSNMQFYRKIKALAGQTPSQFLRTIRLKRAAALLSKNSDNVTQIAYSVGFNSLSYFNKCFKEQFGMTPGQFAESNQVKN